SALLERRSGIDGGVGPCAGFDVEDYLSAREARRVDRFAQLAVAAADQAWAEAAIEDADDARIGVVVGTGVGGLDTLEREGEHFRERVEHARARGGRVYGLLAGYGASNAAFHITQPDEDGRCAVRAMRAALIDAGAQPADVGHVNAHGTSTPFNDRIEVAALREVFGGDPPPTTATKSAIGHLLGAAGAVEAVAALGALERGTLPPTLNFEQPDPEAEIDCIPD